MNDDRSNSGADVRAERTARILVERHGAGAFDFAARQVARHYLADEAASAESWRVIARVIESVTRSREH